MLKLPEMPYQWRKYKSEIVPMRGLNWSDSLQDGDLADSEGISTRRFPYLATRKGRAKKAGYANVEAIYRYRDRVLHVAAGKLYLDGEELSDCSNGPKQWATVNTKVVMWPDRMVIDMETQEVKLLNASITLLNKAADNTLELTATSIKAARFPVVYKSKGQGWTYYNYGSAHVPAYSFCGISIGKDIGTAKDYWDAENQNWTAAAGHGEIKEAHRFEPGDIFILDGGQNIPTEMGGGRAAIEAQYGTGGYYAVVTHTKANIARYYNVDIEFNIYNAGLENALFSSVFQIGDSVEITGTYLGLANSPSAQITGIDDANNTMTFSGGTTIPWCAGQPSDMIASGTALTLRLYYGPVANNYLSRKIVLSQALLPTHYLVVEEEVKSSDDTGKQYTVKVWDGKKYTGTEYITTSGSGSVTLNLFRYHPEPRTGTGLMLRRSVPDLDYICAHDNRLWGVSNEKQTVYGSSLGVPDRFYEYAGVSTDSYAVAVPGNGNFTGCCEFGDAVLFWKEDRLYKLLGDNPDSYQLTDFVVSGVQQGAHETQVIIDDVLIFKGSRGVYAYGGGVPTLISPTFGERRFMASVAGTDGERYYIPLQDGNGWHLLSYDVRRGLWLRESAESARAFAKLPDGLCMVDGSGDVYLMNNGADDPALEWKAQFTPLYETVDGRKGFSKLKLRVELQQAYIKVFARFDGKAWRQVGSAKAGTKNVVTIPVPINRCDKYEIKLEGKGACTVLDIQREFYVGSEA